MHKATSDIEMQMKIIYSFKSEIHKGGRGIIVYEKIKCSTELLTILKDFIDQCEMKWLDLEHNEFRGKLCLPAKRTIEISGSYPGMVVLKPVQIKLVSSKESLYYLNG